jgi:DNA-binding CsgD family transcriptional regulator
MSLGQCIWKPYDALRLERFLRDAMTRDPSKADAIDAVIRDWALRYRLTASETDVLRKTVAGETCEWIADSRGTTVSAIKSQWRQVRIKTGDPTIGAVVRRLLHEAVMVAQDAVSRAGAGSS